MIARRARWRRAGVASLCCASALTVSSLTVSAPAADAHGAAVAPGVRPVSSTPTSLDGWGVQGLDISTSPLPKWKSNVLALAEWQGRIYVGGMFTSVARNGVEVAAQPFLAAFDRDTGAWVSSFRPVLDGGVWDLLVTPRGKLIVGGFFSHVNGAPSAGLAALDPATGRAVSGWHAGVTNDEGPAGVRTLDLQGSWLYVGGNFTALTGGATRHGRTVTGHNLLRVQKATGGPDPAFRPRLLTAPWQVDASSRGDRVYAAGRFGRVNGVAKELLAVLDTRTGRLVPGLKDVRPSYDCRPGCRNPTYGPTSAAVLETADGRHVIATPTEHALQFLKRGNLSRLYGHITLYGGDFQALAESHGVVYAACHCFHRDYGGAWVYTSPFDPPADYDAVHPINMVGAYDAATLHQLPSFQPDVFGSQGDGAWQLLVDSRSCLWIAGDVTHTGSGQWLGGFARFCPSPR